MKFVLIEPAKPKVEIIDAAEMAKACARAGLESTKVDHGVVSRTKQRGISIVVYEFGLFVPVQKQYYFAIGKHLYAGNAILYAFNYEGATIDFLPPIPMLAFFENALAVEDAIHRHTVDRPQMLLNGELIWSWPAEPPSEFRISL